MSKQLNITPEDWFKPGKISFKDIPVCQYKKTIAQEKKLFTRDEFLAIYHDMQVCHLFETVINEIKLKGVFEDVSYSHPGPAHLSLGQEATAVGAAFCLDSNDFTFGSHRSHSEIIAKGLSAIRKLDDAELQKIMEEFFGGATLKVVQQHCKCDTLKELARFFLIYGAYSEIFARVTGFNKGWGGSMHCFFTPFGIYPNNAIVGGSGPIAPGAALYKLVNEQKGIVLCNIGDASFGCGPVWEGLMFSAMGQFKTLWKERGYKGLPILFNCSNNAYGMGGQTAGPSDTNRLGETMGFGELARIGAGVDPDQMWAERVNGYDPLAVIDTMRRQKALLLEGKGPALLDVVTYRTSGHSPSDASSYRTKEELEAWKNFDAIAAYRKKLVDGKIATNDELTAIETTVHDMVKSMFVLAIDPKISPYETMDSMFIESVMFSNKKVEDCGPADRKPEFLQPLEENAQFQKIATKKRFHADENGKKYSKMLTYNICDACFEAMTYRFSKDSTMVAFGEDNRDWGGAYACYRGLTELLPYHRFFNSPISEAAIIGAAVGYALAGGRAVAEIMYCDFIGRCGDELFNQLSKWQAMSGGILRMPVVVRVSVGFKYGAQHSQDWTSIFNHIPGLKVIYPVTPYDEKGLLNAALAGTDPVICLESQQCYNYGEMFHEGGVPEGYYEIPIGEPDVKKAGKDLTIITLGPALYKALDAAKTLQENHGIDAEIIDLRCINPLNYDKLVASIRKTGKAVLVNEAVERGNVMQNVAANLTQLCFDDLDAPIAVVGSRNWVSPAAELEAKFFPQTSWILDTIHERIMPLKGYTPSVNRSLGELQRTLREGV